MLEEHIHLGLGLVLPSVEAMLLAGHSHLSSLSRDAVDMYAQHIDQSSVMVTSGAGPMR